MSTYDRDTVRQSPVALKNKTKLQKSLKIALIALTISIIIGVIVVVAVSIKVGWTLTHPERKELSDSPEQYGLQYSDIEVLSMLDQIKLSAWQIETDEAPKGVIIMAHGYRGNRTETALPALSLAKDFVSNQYHVIMFDFRNSGLSEGNLTTVGFHEKQDLLSIVQYAKEEYPDLSIGVIGFSMGAATSVIAAESDLEIKAVVADSPFSDLRVYLSSNLSYWSGLPEFPFTPTIMAILPPLTGIDPDEVRPLESIKSVDTPLLLIHGDGDTAIPYQNSEEILENTKEGQATLWIPEGSGHVKAYADYPEEYASKVIQFFDQHLGK